MTIIEYNITEVRCPICNKSFKNLYCPSCGLPNDIKELRRSRWLAENPQFCCKCDTPNPERAKYCRNCGEKLHNWVDLGLSVLWSTGSMAGKYLWMDNTAYPDEYSPHEYLYDYTGNGKDVASEIWGAEWRLPTKDEAEELIQMCKWEKIVIPLPYKSYSRYKNNLLAFKVIGPNGNHIIIPTSDQPNIEELKTSCSFWTKTDYPESEGRAYCFRYLDSSLESQIKDKSIWLNTPLGKFRLLATSKYYYFKIRPVADKKWQGKL